MKQHFYTLQLDAIVGGGQTIGTLEDGRKAFVWGGLPGETVTIRVTKKKSKFIEGIVTEVHTPSPERIIPRDPDSYLSTSPWQIMTFDAEQHYKAALVEEAFELHNIVLPEPIEMYSNGVEYGYRNKVEFSWYGSGNDSKAVGSMQQVVGSMGDGEAVSSQNKTEPATASSSSMQPSHSEGSAFPAERDQDKAVSESRVTEEGDGRSDGVSHRDDERRRQSASYKGLAVNIPTRTAH